LDRNIRNPLYGILKAIRLGREHRRCVTEQVAAGSFAEIRRLKILLKLISGETPPPPPPPPQPSHPRLPAFTPRGRLDPARDDLSATRPAFEDRTFIFNVMRKIFDRHRQRRGALKKIHSAH